MTTVQQVITVFFVCKSLTDTNRNLDAIIYYPTLLPCEKETSRSSKKSQRKGSELPFLALIFIEKNAPLSFTPKRIVNNPYLQVVDFSSP